MKRGKKLILLLAVLVLIIGATVAVSLLNPQEEAEGTTYTTVFSLDPDKVTNLGWDYSDEVNFTKTENGWVNDADAAFPVDENCLEEMLRILSDVGASNTIENVEDLDQYGLLYPFSTITVTVDGVTHNLAIGDQNSYNGERYFSIGDGNVYMVANEIASHFAFGPEGALLMEELPILSDITKLKVQSNVQSYEIAYEVGTDRVYSTHYKWFMDGKVLDTELTETLLTVLEELEWRECADYNATDLSQYGLATPVAVVTTTRLEEDFVLEMGTETDKGVYARIAGSNMVYLIDDDFMDTLVYTTYSELMPDEVLAMDWDTLTGMDITLNGQTYTFTCSEAADENGCATGDMAWKLGDTEVDGLSITDKLDSMGSMGYATGLTPELEQEVRFVFHRNDSHHQTVELVLYRYNSESCLVTLDGVSTVLADRTDVTTLINAINKIVG